MSIERRNSFRFSLSEELRGATLEARSRRLPVELLDQSADGFSIKTPRDFEIAIDEVVVIETWAGRCRATVARMVDCHDYRRIGLRRVSDITACSRRPSWLGAWLREGLARPGEEGSRKRLAWAAASLGAVALLVAAGWEFYGAAAPQATAPDQGPARMAAGKDASPAADAAIGFAQDATPGQPGSPATSATAAGDSAPTAQAITVPASYATPAATETEASAVNSDRPPSVTFKRLALLRNAKVASDLALSEKQKLEISRLLKRVSSDLARVQASTNFQSRAARELKLNSILGDAEAQANEILSPQQQARWQTQ